jgi:hypothetical protein
MKKLNLDIDKTVAILIWLAIVYTSAALWSDNPFWFTVLPIIMSIWLVMQLFRPTKIERQRGKRE